MTEWTFKGEAKRLEDIDLPRIGKTIGVGEDELHAFIDVEAAGSGFDAKGRPKMLFEPHIFYKLLGKGKARNAAVKAGVAYAKWKPKGYPKDSYGRLAVAMSINATLALMSASWGAFQIMGFNHGAACYATPEAMIRDFMADEDNHVEAAVRFIINKKLDDDLRAHRWDVIEQVYNGGGFDGLYARKMAKAFARWQKIKDTPLPEKRGDIAGETEAATPSVPEAPNLRQEAPAPVPATPIPAKAEKPPSPPSSDAPRPSVGQVATTTGVVATGATLLGVPWQYVVIAAALVFAAVIAFIITRPKRSA